MMRKQKTFIALAAALSLGASLFLAAGCGGPGTEADADAILLATKGPKGGNSPIGIPSSPTSFRGVTPTAYAGNFVASDDDQVCYDMSELGYIGNVTSEMRGFKIDPPVDFANNNVNIALSSDGKFLDWETYKATMMAFIIKGGPNYNVYDYVGTGFNWDKGLGSPQSRNLPQISHYNLCYEPEGGGADEGCTPGYWRNHADRWLGVAPGADFDTTFGVDLFTPDITLGQAIWLGGGGANALARHATAALLNAFGGVPNADGEEVDYAYTVAQVIGMVQDAVANDTIEATKDLFAAANEAGCPLGGTRALRVVQ